MSIYQLLYTSTATAPFTELALVDLLDKARLNNQQQSITGLLLHHDGKFMQVLEGDAERVEALFAIIAADPRHNNVFLVSQGEVSGRQFPDWSMGFVPMGESDFDEVVGYLNPNSSVAFMVRTMRAAPALQQLLQNHIPGKA
ncbi:BLUF domain-containing protein [Hymenobacter glacialis]|uniref:BLUF domain-containing protein n=1 Tax=Hymenobacter glacialis TaxID=1908236 RepID=A0A1G1T7N8_9BACT|nr:BLUF domain-containing protein [Hymenobacter glacialis]OGX86883.1 hypothetical protein BEN48_00525 [Hymenobacter glacialis]